MDLRAIRTLFSDACTQWNEDTPFQLAPASSSYTFFSWSSRAQARAALGREFPTLTLSIMRRVPSPTFVHVSCAPSKIPDSEFSPVRLQAVASFNQPYPA